MLVFLTGLFWITPLMSYDSAPNQTHSNPKHTQIPNTLKSQTHSNPKHTQIQDTWVGNSHACFQETSLKTLTPILQQRPQEYKIYRASSLHFIKVQDKSASWHHPSYTPTPQ